jgi:hypothetical protein
MFTIWLLASFLILPQPARACAEAPAKIGAVQPPESGEPTPEPGEPVDPPVLEEPPDAPDDPALPTPDPAAPCCFDHPRYSGTCVVTPVGDETCASILDYLNDQRSAGKTYCNHTDLRGGWKPVQCPAR